MAVNLTPPPYPLAAVAGIRLASTGAVKSKKRDDLTVMEIAPGAAVAGVFTRNKYPAPPVQICRKHLATSRPAIRGLAINAGIANAGTLGQGLRNANESCRLLAQLLNCRPQQILPFSTGIIMEHLPMQKYADGLHRCAHKLAADNWDAAAHAIMTTDTVAKGGSRQFSAGGQTFTVTGIAKGSGMIHPNMATMLAFVATDAAVDAQTLAQWQRRITAETFNAVSVDGDTSTNDSFMLIATGKAGGKINHPSVRAAMTDLCAQLAESIIRDGEGASKLITICVRGGKSRAVCRRVAETVARSPLVKTALAASDANVGRFLMAIGNAGSGFLPEQVAMTIGDVPVILGGGIHPQYNEQQAAKVLKQDEIIITIDLGNGRQTAQIKTCDLTAGYVEINAAYRN